VAGLSLGAPPAAAARTEAPGERYVREALLGAGGMGRVYLAFDRTLGRWVAVKEAREGAAAAAALDREAAVVGRLDHPGVVAVHDRGVGPDGRPWYAMRLVRGQTLREAVEARPGLAERLLLLTHFRDLCQAVAHAHSAGVVHRDLKPDNVLVGAFGETQVVDWGLAVGADAPPEPGVAGSPPWMAPEQARGEAADRRTDVWGLGAVLFHLLTGAPIRSGGDGAALLARATAEAPPPVGAREPRVPAELAAITTRALQMAREDRYPDAAALAADVERYLTGERVSAHQYGAGELLARFVRAWRAPLVVAAVAAALLGVGALVATGRLAAERDTAVRARADAEQALRGSWLAQARQHAAAGRPAAAGVLGAAALAGGEDPEARGAVLAALSQWPARRLSAAALGDCPNPVLDAGDGWLCRSADAVWAAGPGGTRWRVPGRAVDVTVAGPLVAVQHEKTAVLLDHATGERRGTYTRISPLPLMGTPDGRFAARRWEGTSWSGPLDPLRQRLHVGCAGRMPPRESALHPWAPLHASGCADGAVAVTAGDQPPVVWPTGVSVAEHGDVSTLAWAPDGVHLALGWYRARLGWLNVQTGAFRSVALPGDAAVTDIAVSPDSALLAVRRDDSSVQVWDATSLARVADLPGARGVALRWEDATVLRVLGEALVRWEITRQPAPPEIPVGFGVAGVMVRPDGAAVWTTHSDGVVVQTPLAPGVPGWHRVVGRGVVGAADPSPTGAGLLVSPAEDREVLALGPDGQPTARWSATGGVRQLVALGADDVLAVDYGGVAWRLRPGSAGVLPGCAPGAWRTILPSRRRGPALLLGWDQSLAIVGPEGCGPPLPHRGTRAAVGPTGAWLVALDADGLYRAPMEAGPVAWRAPLDLGETQSLAVSPDGRWVVAGGRDAALRVFSADTGTLRAVLRGHGGRVSAIDFTPDGRWMVSGAWDGTARSWALAALEEAPAALAATLAAWGWPGPDALDAAVSRPLTRR
jgi:hypothetical protein